jgi:lariat debranching enzyme
MPTPTPFRAGTAPRLTYDPEWLAITRAFHPYLSTDYQQRPFPDERQARQMVEQELEWVRRNVGKGGDGLVDVLDCQQFVMTAPAQRGTGDRPSHQQRKHHTL